MSLGADTMLLQMWQQCLSRSAVKNTGFSVILEITTSFSSNIIFLFHKIDNEIYILCTYIYIYAFQN
jgi:hypothetical protein